MTALRRDIFVTPIESTMVTTAASPSGMAATARLTATIKVSRMLSPVMFGALRSRSTPKITAQMTMTSTLRMRLSWLSFFCSGVSSSRAFASASAILPISVFMPVPTTTARPRPYTTVLPIYAMLRRSPSGTSCPSSAASASTCLFTDTDSPVSAASSTFRLAHSVRRTSAGIASPASSTTTSPGTSSSLRTVCCCPSRSTLEVAAAISCSASIAFSALLSCITPNTALMTTTDRIMMTSAKDSPE